jgi:hypothetical protein
MAPGEIARSLNEAKILSPSCYKHSKGIINHSKLIGSEFWRPRVISDMLTDRMYIGDMVQGKSQRINHKEVVVPPDKWVIVPNIHEPVVSREIFDKVQEIRQRISKLHAENKDMGAYSPNLFKGKIFCAKCGHLMHRNRQNKDGIYWFRCESRWRFTKDTCTVVSVKETDLKTEIVAILHKHAEIILGKFISLERETNRGDSTADSELREINSKLDKDGRMLRSLYESMVSEVITRDEFIQMKADYESKIADLSRRADEIRNIRRETENKKDAYIELAAAVSAVLANDRLTEEIIDKLVEKVCVNPDKSFGAYFKFADVFGGNENV